MTKPLQIAVKLTLLALIPSIAGTAQAATVETSLFGTAADGQPVALVTLRNSKGMTVRFSARGGAITEILAPDRHGKVANIVLGRADFAAWERAGSFNSVVGRFADRIAGGAFALDGTTYKLAGANPTTSIVIHGGPTGFAGRLFAVAPFSKTGEAGATLDYVSPDGENGYPGTLKLRMTYTLTDTNVLRLAYEATTDKPTIINLTNHAYFNLAGADSGPMYNHVLQIFASRYSPQDARQIPTGELLPVDGTPFDFRKPTRIADNIYKMHPQIALARGIDHNFMIDGWDGKRMVLAARLSDPSSGRQVEVRTTEPSLRPYTANNLNGSTAGANGRTLRQGDGVTLETEHLPDSPNQPSFPSTVLRPGESYHSVTEYAFSIGGPRLR